MLEARCAGLTAVLKRYLVALKAEKIGGYRACFILGNRVFALLGGRLVVPAVVAQLRQLADAALHFEHGGA